MAIANEYGYFWNSNNQDRLYNADSFEEWFKKFFSTGVFSGDLAVTAKSGMNISVATGYSNLNGKVGIFNEINSFQLQTSSSSAARYDTVVIERNDLDRIIELKVVTGTASGSPTPIAPVRSGGIYQIVLAQIYVGAGVSSITQSNISDTRSNETICGIVKCTTGDLESKFNNYLPLAGGTMTGNIKMGANTVQVTNIQMAPGHIDMRCPLDVSKAASIYVTNDGNNVRVRTASDATSSNWGTDATFKYFDIPIGLTFNAGNAITGISASGKTVTYIKANGGTGTFTTQDTTYTLPAATSSTLGGVKTGTNITNSSGTISIANASTSAKGVVQLSDATTSTSTTLAATANRIKVIYDNFLKLTGGTLTGELNINQSSQGGAINLYGTSLSPAISTTNKAKIAAVSSSTNTARANGLVIKADNNQSNSLLYLTLDSTSGTSNTFSLHPGNSGSMRLGHSTYKWGNIYSTNGAIQTSDKNYKKNIKALGDKYVELFSLLTPVSYQFKDGESGRTHVGFIAQDVESAMEKVGLSNLEFAGFCKDKRYDDDGNYLDDIYSLRYDEFVALNTRVLQIQQEKISKLESKIDDLVSRLEKLEQR